MKYMGSKQRYAKELLPIILKDRQEGQWYVEPFVGGCNMIDKVTESKKESPLSFKCGMNFFLPVSFSS